mgnify:CR=1 FL=1
MSAGLFSTTEINNIIKKEELSKIENLLSFINEDFEKSFGIKLEDTQYATPLDFSKNLARDIKKYSDFNLVVLDENLEKVIDSCTNFDLDEVEELKSFNGTLAYKLVDENSDELVVSQTFANIAKVSNDSEVYLISKDEKIKRVLKIDKNLNGTIGILKTKINEDIFNGYKYKQVKIEKVEA